MQRHNPTSQFFVRLLHKPLDPTKYVLGKLCPHQHDHQQTGQSLRRRSNSTCRECELASKRASRRARAGRPDLVALGDD